MAFPCCSIEALTRTELGLALVSALHNFHRGRDFQMLHQIKVGLFPFIDELFSYSAKYIRYATVSCP